MGINLLSCINGLRVELQDSYLYLLTLNSNIKNKNQKSTNLLTKNSQ